MSIPLHGMNGDELNALFQMAWIFVTPFVLTGSVIIMAVYNTYNRHWNRFMTQGTFVLMLSYAVLIDRVFLRYLGVIPDATIAGTPPEWPWTAFYLICAIYYGAALVFKWAIPGVYRMIYGHRPPPPMDDGEDDVDGVSRHA